MTFILLKQTGYVPKYGIFDFIWELWGGMRVGGVGVCVCGWEGVWEGVWVGSG